MAGSLSAQTLTDVINEFNLGVSNVNNQEYDASLEHFNHVITLAEAVGDSAADRPAAARSGPRPPSRCPRESRRSIGFPRAVLPCLCLARFHPTRLGSSGAVLRG